MFHVLIPIIGYINPRTGTYVALVEVLVILLSVTKRVLAFSFRDESVYVRGGYVYTLLACWCGRKIVLSNDMQIVTSEDATCVPNIYMHVASGFVGNLLCKWIRSSANRNETLNTIWWAIFVLIQLVAVRCRPCFIFTECEVNVKCIKPYELLSIFYVTLQCLLPRDVLKHSFSLPVFAVSVSHYIRKKSRLCRHSHMCVCACVTFEPAVTYFH